jgi:hypothetical protein
VWQETGGEERDHPPEKIALSLLCLLHVMTEEANRKEGWRVGDWEVVAALWEAAGVGRVRRGTGRGSQRFFEIDWERAVGEGWYEPGRQQEYLAMGQGRRTGARTGGRGGILGDVPGPRPVPAPQVRQGDGSGTDGDPLSLFAMAVSAIVSMPGAQLGEVHPFSPPRTSPSPSRTPVKKYLSRCTKTRQNDRTCQNYDRSLDRYDRVLTGRFDRSSQFFFLALQALPNRLLFRRRSTR